MDNIIKRTCIRYFTRYGYKYSKFLKFKQELIEKGFDYDYHHSKYNKNLNLEYEYAIDSIKNISNKISNSSDIEIIKMYDCILSNNLNNYNFIQHYLFFLYKENYFNFNKNSFYYLQTLQSSDVIKFYNTYYKKLKDRIPEKHADFIFFLIKSYFILCIKHKNNNIKFKLYNHINYKKLNKTFNNLYNSLNAYNNKLKKNKLIKNN